MSISIKDIVVKTWNEMGGFKSFFHRIIWMSIIVTVPMIFATFINNIYICFILTFIVFILYMSFYYKDKLKMWITSTK